MNRRKGPISAQSEPTSIKTPADNDWISSRAAVLVGLVGLACTVVAITALEQRIVIALTAATVAMVYGVYFGFAVKSGEPKDLATEGGFILLGLATVVLGLEQSHYWLAVGLLLHGIWDLLHHPRHRIVGTAGVPGWYVPFCAVYDISAALAITLLI